MAARARGNPCVSSRSDDPQALIARLFMARISLRGICRAVGVKLKWLLGLLVQRFEALPNHHHVQPVAYNGDVMIQQLEVKVDGMSSFVAHPCPVAGRARRSAQGSTLGYTRPAMGSPSRRARRFAPEPSALYAAAVGYWARGDRQRRRCTHLGGPPEESLRGGRVEDGRLRHLQAKGSPQAPSFLL
jgi:hypothetical protein